MTSCDSRGGEGGHAPGQYKQVNVAAHSFAPYIRYEGQYCCCCSVKNQVNARNLCKQVMALCSLHVLTFVMGSACLQYHIKQVFCGIYQIIVYPPIFVHVKLASLSLENLSMDNDLMNLDHNVIHFHDKFQIFIDILTTNTKCKTI